MPFSPFFDFYAFFINKIAYFTFLPNFITFLLVYFIFFLIKIVKKFKKKIKVFVNILEHFRKKIYFPAVLADSYYISIIFNLKKTYYNTVLYNFSHAD
jgi:hypothetical protein